MNETDEVDLTLANDAVLVRGGRFQTPPELRDLVRDLSRLRNAPVALALCTDWAAAIALVWFAGRFGTWWSWFPLAFLVGTRQHAIGVLMHDGAHYRLHPDRTWSERISDWFTAYPLFITTDGYRVNHFAHHRYLNTTKDPDWMVKKGNADWEFPKSPPSFALVVVRQWFGGGLVTNLRRYSKGATGSPGDKADPAARRSTYLDRWAFYFVVAAALTVVGGWRPFLLYWVLPYMTFLPMLLRIRSVGEHFGMQWTSDLDMSRSTESDWAEKILLLPHNVHFHLDHHLFPSVPFYNLGMLHKALLTMPGFPEQAHISRGYFTSAPTSLIADLAGKRKRSTRTCLTRQESLPCAID